MSKELLTEDKQHLTLFDDGVVINKSLVKWKRAEDGIKKTEAPKKESQITINSSNSTSIQSNHVWYVGNMIPEVNVEGSNVNEYDVDSPIDGGRRWLPLYQTPEGLNFDEIASAGIKDLTRMLVEKKIKYVMGGYGSFGTTATNESYGNPFNIPFSSNKDKDKKEEKNGKLKSLFEKLFNNKKEKEETYEFDAIKFFSLVKATSKESAFTYKDRISNYLKALHNSVDMGQTALQEELLKGLITNKYESLLYAEGYYYVIDEETIVDFIKKCEKGLSLDYIKNFTRPIPQNVVEKIQKLNELEIFDNYVVLHYDPKKTAYKETEYERAKRKDPIIFGLIAGSKKLYYVTDWIDEYCDLTLEKFVDTLGIKKESLQMEGASEATEKEEVPTEEKPKKPKKKFYNKKKNKKNKQDN